jgi:hypothetical protein
MRNMTMKYWHLKLKGERSADEIQSVVGRMSGKVVRSYLEGDETHVFFAAEESASADMAKTMEENATLEEASAATAHSGGTPRPRAGK